MPPTPRCPGCQLRIQHEVNGFDCREMQYEREWKNREDHDADDDLDVLA